MHVISTAFIVLGQVAKIFGVFCPNITQRLNGVCSRNCVLKLL